MHPPSIYSTHGKFCLLYSGVLQLKALTCDALLVYLHNVLKKQNSVCVLGVAHCHYDKLSVVCLVIAVQSKGCLLLRYLKHAYSNHVLTSFKQAWS